MQSGHTLLLMEGNHSTLLKGIPVTEAEDAVSDGRLQDRAFVYFQPENWEDNAICVDPNKVVAIIATPI